MPKRELCLKPLFSPRALRDNCQLIKGHKGSCGSTTVELTRKRQKERRDSSLARKLKNQPCADCNNSYHYSAMDFDHRVGTVKKFGVAAHTNCSPDFLRDELMKCDVVCANCHRIRTWNRRQWSIEGKDSDSGGSDDHASDSSVTVKE